jgi:histidine triad (HIT) family protein
MNDCIFCRIVAGELAAEVVHATPDAVAFLDRTPAARGHVMVVPRAHAANLLELDDRAIGGLFAAVKEVQRKIDAALHPMAFHVGWNHGAGAGQHVFHLHVHVLPRHRERGRGVQQLGEGGGAGDLAEVAAAIRAA